MGLRKVIWNTDSQFNYQVPFGDAPVFDNVEVVGSNGSAYLALKEKNDNSDDVTFTTPGNYTYDDTKIEVVNGKAQLKASVQGTQNYPYTTPGNYTYNTNKMEVVGGVAKLKGSPLPTYAWYHLNESSGSVVSDSSGNARNGSTVNMEDSDWVSGKLNNALRFDGTNEYVDTNFAVSWERDQPVSFEFFVKTSTSGVTQMIISNFASPGGQLRGHEIFINTNNKIRFYLFGNNLNRLGVESTNTVTDGNWHHVIVTYDGSSTPGGCHIYIDNNDETLTTIYNTLGTTTILSTNFHIAKRQSGGLYFTGDLDEIVFYDIELDAAQVAQRWNNGNGTETAIGAYYQCGAIIETNNGFVFSSELGSFDETGTKPTGTNLKYQLSIDNGTTYKWWDGDSWENRTTSRFDLPDSITLNTGTYISGNLASIQSVDANLYVIDEVTGNPGFDIEIGFENIGNFPETISFWGYYTGNPAHNVDVQIYNVNTAAWDTLGQIPHDASSTVTQYNFVPAGDIDNYIDTDCKVLIRIYHSSNGSAGHDFAIDHIRTVGTPTPKWYSENESNLSSGINGNLADLGSSGTLKINAILTANENSSSTPELDNIRIEEGVSYPTDPQIIEMDFDIDPTDIYSWLTLTETSTKPSGTTILYQYSVDSGSNYNVSWLTEAQVETAIQSIPSPDTIRFKFQLDTNDGDLTPELDNVNITSDAGFETSGSYTSTGYFPEYTYTGGMFLETINFTLTESSGNTITIGLREGTREIDYNSGFPEYSDGEDLDICADIIQWKATFSGSGDTTPKLHELWIDFHLLIGIMRAIDESLERVLGLAQENFFLDNTVYEDYQGQKLLTSGRIRIYTDAVSVGTVSNVLATYNITATYTDGKLDDYKVVKA